MSERETWATRAGFILAAVGSAVGLGNIWRFPFQVGENGGAAFVLVYLLFVIAIGFPAMLAEFVVGRRTKLNPAGALRDLGGRTWEYVGYMFLFTAFVILSYYSVVAGWTLRYTYEGLAGGYAADLATAEAQFGSMASGLDALALHAVFMLSVLAIVGLGIRQGIELAVKVMVPAIIVLVIGLAAYAFTLDGASAAYSYYLSPDLSVIANNWQSILPAAAGQAFFTLSIGMGVMITYASYLGEDRNLVEDGIMIISLDTLVAFVTGLIVFPIIFSAPGVAPGDPGAGAIFVVLAAAFAEIPLGGILGAVFFATVAIAALSSSISILEVVVSYLVDDHGYDRFRATALLTGAIFLLGIPSALDIIFVDVFDKFVNGILLVLGALILSAFVGWVIPDVGADELKNGIGNPRSLDTTWLWLLRIPVLVVLAVVVVLGVLEYYTFLT
ncbi:MAG TPA: sodium-dependent transporter, partial [Natronoarchaeum rubrum]|nr:sodium-dependent transporter [Natronoarchaeum rubrum]